MTTMQTFDESAQHAYERAMMGTTFLEELSQELRRRLQAEQALPAGINPSVALGAAVCVAKACCQVSWFTVTTTARALEPHCGLPLIDAHGRTD